MLSEQRAGRKTKWFRNHSADASRRPETIIYRFNHSEISCINGNKTMLCVSLHKCGKASVR